jgi:hypothetical protein
MTRHIISVFSVLCAVGAVLFLWWPLAALAVVVLAFDGRWFFAVFLGLLFDLFYGTPIGIFSFTMLPFVILAALCVLARAIFIKLMRRGLLERL